MDFLDPDKKKKHTRRLYAGYFLIGVGIILASVILLFQAFGYDLDRKTGKVIQNGLIFAASAPESTTIYLNGEEKGQTESRLTVPAGAYTMELKREGYRTWKRSFNLEGSSIERLVYPLLFPEKLEPEDVKTYDAAPAFSTQSPDRRWIMVQKPGSMTAFEVFDASDPEVPTKDVVVAEDLMSTGQKNRVLTLVEWSTDNRHVLLKHAYDGGYEFIVIDRENPAISYNVNKTLAVNPTTVTLRDKKFDQLYLYDQQARTLSRADTKSKQITKLYDGILAYKSYGADTLLYAIVDSKNPDKAIVKVRDDSKEYAIRSYAATTEFLLDITRFDNRWYVVVGPKSDGRVSIYRDPMSIPKDTTDGLPLPYSSLIMKDPQFVSFSANARFIVAQNGPNFAVYDAETNRRFYYTIDQQISAQQKALWMDGHRLLIAHEGQLSVFDFDGINQRSIANIQAGTIPFFDRDYNRLYTLRNSLQAAEKAALTITPIKIDIQQN